MRNRPPSPQYCLFLPVAFLFSKKKRTLSKNRFGARVPMGFETFFPLPLVTQVAWQDIEERAGEKTELVRDKRIGGEKSPSECLEKGLW